MFYTGLYMENMKQSSCLIPKVIEPWYLVCGIILWTSAKFVQIKPLWSKMGTPLGVTCLT